MAETWFGYLAIYDDEHDGIDSVISSKDRYSLWVMQETFSYSENRPNLN